MNKNWKPCKIMDLIAKGEAELKTGPFGTQLHASDYVETGTPVINVRNVGFGSIREDNLEFISEETVQRLKSHLLEAKDIVFGRKGAVERHAFIEQKHVRWFQGSDCLRLRIKSSRILPRFLSYYFQTEAHKQWMIKQCSHGSTMASLNQDIISRISFPLPFPQTQHKIVAILSAYDDLIDNNTHRIAILEEMAQTIYQEWFVHFRYPGHEKNKMVESELGMIPEGWEITVFAKAADFVNGYAFKPHHWGQTGKPIVKIAELKNGITEKTPYYNGSDIPLKYHIQNGDLLFSWSADLDIYIWSHGEALLNQHLFNVVPFSGLTKTYLFFALKEHLWEFKSRSQGTTMKHIKRSALDEVHFLFPPEEITASFEELVSPVLSQIQNLTSKNLILRRTRDLLLPKLISGEIDVEALDIDIPDMPEPETQQHNTAPIVQPEPIDASQLAFLF